MQLDDEFFNYFALYLFLVIAFLIIIAMINRYTSHDEPCKVAILDTSDFKTGDILGVGYSNAAGMFTSSFSRSVWSHCGTIWVDPKTEIVYVLEGAIYPNKLYQHIVRIPFTTWYRYNNKFILGIIKYNGPEIDANAMYESFSKFSKAKVKLEGFGPSWGRFLVNTKYYKAKMRKSYTCYEMTILMHQDLNIYKKEKLHC
jgi:hypothetical protein